MHIAKSPSLYQNAAFGVKRGGFLEYCFISRVKLDLSFHQVLNGAGVEVAEVGDGRETGDAREQLCDSDVSGDALIHLGLAWAEAKETRQIHLAYDMSGMAQSAGRALPGERHYQED